MMTFDITKAAVIGRPIEVGTSGHTMIDIADYDANASLPQKFKNNYDVQDNIESNAVDSKDRGASIEFYDHTSSSRDTYMLQTVASTSNTMHFDIFDEDDCESAPGSDETLQ
eukprot:4183169-Heterocapsa_arctica.AAC.1